MKNLFPGYYSLEKKEKKEIWENAIFVFDTNVLLNLYRYESETVDELLKMMNNLSDRVWIPYHVALEFQRNRLKVINAQSNRFSEVADIIEKCVSDLKENLNKKQLRKKHSHINPDEILKEFSELKSQHIKKLEKLKTASLSTNSKDKIREKIDTIFKDKVGSNPKKQEVIDKILTDGEYRYENKIPPGFSDSEKGDEGFVHTGIKYVEKYGDLIIWSQIIEYVKNENISDIIFITDDQKKDWWLKVSGKTIGPRPELIDEIKSKTEIDNFYMYTPLKFLENGSETIGTKLEKKIIDDVKEVSRSRNKLRRINNLRNHGPIRRNSFGQLVGVEIIEKNIIYNWIAKEHRNVEYDTIFDFSSRTLDGVHGFEVKYLKRKSISPNFIENVLAQTNSRAKMYNYTKVTVVLAFERKKDLELMSLLLDKGIKIDAQVDTNIVLGMAKKSPITTQDSHIHGVQMDDSVYEFEPVHMISVIC